MKIKFIKSPTGKYKLGYSVGSVGEVENAIAKKCIDDGYAVEVKAPIKKFTKKSK